MFGAQRDGCGRLQTTTKVTGMRSDLGETSEAVATQAQEYRRGSQSPSSLQAFQERSQRLDKGQVNFSQSPVTLASGPLLENRAVKGRESARHVSV